MKQFLVTILFIISCSGYSFAQGVIKPELPPLDSSLLEDSLIIPQTNLPHQLIDNNLYSTMPAISLYKLPDFDFNQEIFNLRQDYNYYISNPNGFSNINIPITMSPFTRSATIFSQGAYKLSNRITIGGNSFGAKSIFSAPLPNQQMNNFDSRGASMFFQYKVSKKIKIETSINISNNRY